MSEDRPASESETASRRSVPLGSGSRWRRPRAGMIPKRPLGAEHGERRLCRSKRGSGARGPPIVHSFHGIIATEEGSTIAVGSNISATMRTRWLLAIAIGIASMLGCVRGDRTAPAHSASFSLVERVEEAETSFDETFFRSVRKDGRLVNAVTMEGRTELSLTPPLPSRLRYRLRVPDAPSSVSPPVRPPWATRHSPPPSS